jgi:hypothetical protein
MVADRIFRLEARSSCRVEPRTKDHMGSLCQSVFSESRLSFLVLAVTNTSCSSQQQNRGQAYGGEEGKKRGQKRKSRLKQHKQAKRALIRCW